MSKAISTALKTHLAGAVTTLATCWQIIRLDGAVFSFTSCDRDLVIEGTTYSSIIGFSRTAIISGSTGQVDNLEVIGMFAEGGVTEQDMKNGLFYWATIYVFIVNWADLTQGILRMRRGWLGETTRLPNGTFKAELRGLTQALVQETGNVISPLCRADLGDRKCQVPILPGSWTATTPKAAGDWISPAVKSTSALKVAIFECTSIGTTGTTEPSWNTAIDATTSDGTAVWTSRAPMRLIGTVGTPISRHQFTCSPALVYPAGQLGTEAAIDVHNNVSGGTALEVSDGVNTANAIWLFDVSGSLAAMQLVDQIIAAGLNMTVVNDSGRITLTNHTGKQGHISKTGDIADPPAFLINDFAPFYLDQGTIVWITGYNAGVACELKTYDINTTSVVLWLGMLFPITAGDTFFYYPGCDKKRETCLQKFNNMLNFRAEPDVPGLDRMLGYPDAT
jgi:hypothetical protein